MSIVGEVLDALFDIAQILPRPFETKYAWNRRLRHLTWKRYGRSVKALHRKGLVRIVKKKDKQFLQITQKGQLEILLTRAKLPLQDSWDGKWRLIIFDIPESNKTKRNLFRKLLKSNGFHKLQASVYINPQPLNRSAIEYLKITGLIGYIRILRVDDMDEDILLKKKFKLD